MTFTLPDLPFAREALQPFMSAETLDLHHGKHHRAYVEKTNQLCDENGLDGRSLIEVIAESKVKGQSALFNNSAQLWNHSFFWQCLAPSQGQQPTGLLAQRIEDEFSTAAQMLASLQ